jgi:hypothetical protein
LCAHSRRAAGPSDWGTGLLCGGDVRGEGLGIGRAGSCLVLG